MGSEGSHNTQNDTPLAPGAKQRKNEQKKFAIQAKTHELITSVEVNHQLGAPQHGGSFSFDMGIPVEERATH
ncbi:hypothetical protein EV1_045326 [Malus domestica]